MATERLPCRTEGCANTILPATAKANDGYCMPCVQKRHSEQREKYIRENRRQVDPYAGVTDDVEIIRELHTPKARDPLITFLPPPKSIEELYSGLSVGQAARLMHMAAEAMRTGHEHFAEDIAKSLATLTDYPLDSMLIAWVERNHYWPAVIFRNAGEEIRDRVIDALESSRANANHALSALAWIGDGKVQQVFRQWELNPPAWRSKLYVGPAQYAHVAGWELGTTERRDLFHDTCWAVTPAAANSVGDEAVTFMREAAKKCPWCKRQLVNLLEIDLTDNRFDFLALSGKRLPILTCDACTCYGTAFMYSQVSPDGEAQLTEENKQPEWLPNDIDSWERSPWKDQPVQLHRRRPIHAVDWCMCVTISQVGGLPSWVQDSAFPNCPKCSKTMMFIAQVDNGQFPHHEGVYYAFLCSACRVTATTYQQT
jgi:hypothetical protein